MHRLAEYCEVNSDLFQCHKRNGSVHAQRYITGLLSSAERKNMEQISEVIPKAEMEGLQNFLSDSPWKVEPVWKRVGCSASDIMGGGSNNMLMVDESGFSKKGKCSVGVARQYNGRLGKVDNCQVGVFSALSHGCRTTLVGARLYLPKEWTSDPKRCEAVGIPNADRQHKTKQILAWELIEEAIASGVQFDWLGMDAAYGRDQTLLLKIAGLGKTFVADVDCHQRVWLKKPPGLRRPKEIIASGAKRVDAVWKAAKSEAREMEMRNGENGPVRIQFWRRRVWIWPNTSEIPMEVWLLVSVRSDGTVKYSLSNADAEMAFEELGKRQGQRHFVEVCFKDGKSHLGMAEYEGRKWRFWHHHMALVGLAMLFTVTERKGYKTAMPLLSVRDVVEIIGGWFASLYDSGAREQRIHKRHLRRTREMDKKQRRAGKFVTKLKLPK